MKYLKPVGFWRQTLDSKENLPYPTEMVDQNWSFKERAMVIEYLDSCKAIDHYKGSALCRICKEWLGSADCSDGTYIFPEKYQHYILKHNVKPPGDFIDHVFKEMIK